MEKIKKRSQFMEVWKRLRKNKLAMLGLCILIVEIIVALFANQIADYDTLVIPQDIAHRFEMPSSEHILGLDELGRDIFARLVHGSRVSLSVGLLAVGISLIFGGFLGAVAGYYGGKIDNVIMRVMDVLMAVPAILLAIAIVAALGPSLRNLMLAIGVASIPSYARIVRASVMTVKGQEYIEAARAIGARTPAILIHHIIPNALAPVIVQSTLGVANAILSTSALSFIGLGIQPPAPEWGAMLSGGKTFLRDAWHITLFPGLAIMITILALNLFGDGLRDALDPKLKR